MASFEKRGKKYRAVVSVMDNGVRRKVSKTFPTKKEATEWATIMEADKFQNKKIIASSMTFSDWFKFWMENYKKNNVREATYATYKSDYHVIEKYFGDITLANLTYPILQSTLDKIGETQKQSSNTNLAIKIRSALKEAEYEQYIKHDIYSRLKAHGVKTDKKSNVLSATEFEKLQNYLYQNYQGDLINGAILVALETGMRIGEVLAFNSNDVSISFQTIVINKSFSQTACKITPPKNKHSVRKIKITKELAQVINSYGYHEERIFNMSHPTVRRRLDSILDELNLTPITTHGLRHSHASYLLYRGVSINYVSARLGHANVSITQRVYAHMLQEEKQREQEHVVEILSMSPNVPKQSKKS